MIQSPEQLRVDHWYKIQYIKPGTFKVAKHKVRYAGWDLVDEQIVLRGWRHNRSGKWEKVNIHWKSITRMESLYAC